jgi:tRNA(Ile)-lysidine synthase
MYNKIHAYIANNRMIEPDDHIVAGISGGADSVCLLFILLKLQKEISFTIRAVHVNHMLRAEATEDAAFVAELCRQQGVELRIYSANVAKLARIIGLSIEEAGREYRYECFMEDSPESAKIAVAHHQDDRAETILFNLFRGSGLKGLSGIRPVRDNIIRPLLCCTRQEIEDYLESQNIPYCTDPTNAEDIYTRNRIRRHIIPFAAEVNPAAVRHMAKTADLVWEAESFIHKHTELALRECVNFSSSLIEINIKKFNELDMFIKKRIMLLVVEKLLPGRRNISARHIENLLSLTIAGGSQELHLPYGLIAHKEYDTIVIKKQKPASIVKIDENIQKDNEVIIVASDSPLPVKEQNINIPNLGVISYHTFTYQQNENIPQKTYTKWFDYDKITTCVVFRRRKTGDYLIINRDGQHKKLKEYLINEKMPKAKREELYVLADASHIIWVPGLRISEYYKVTDETTTVLEISLEIND